MWHTLNTDLGAAKGFTNLLSPMMLIELAELIRLRNIAHKIV